MNLCRHAVKQIFGRYPVGFLCVQVKRNGRVDKFKDGIADRLNMTRECRLDVVEVLAPLKDAVFRHRFGLLDVRLRLCLARQA